MEESSGFQVHNGEFAVHLFKILFLFLLMIRLLSQWVSLILQYLQV